MTSDGLDKPNWPYVAYLGTSHNPEVAGSNPAPATLKGPGDGAFRLGPVALRGGQSPRRVGARPGGWLGGGRSTAGGIGRSTGSFVETLIVWPWWPISSESPSRSV